MKKITFLLLVFLLSYCMKPIMVNSVKEGIDRIPSFGLQTANNFFVNKEVSSNLVYEWDSNTHGSFSNTSFIAFDSIIIVPDLAGRITAFNISNGKKYGELKYGGSIEQTLVLENSFLLALVNEEKENVSTLNVYDILNGKEVRSVKLIGKFGNEFVSTEEFIYAVSDFGKVYKIAKWGQIEWVKDFNVNIYSNPIADSDILYLATGKGRILKVDLTDGTLLDEFIISNGFESGFNIDDDNVFIGDNNGVLYCIDKRRGTINWEFNSSSKIVQTPGIDLKNIYFGNLEGKIYALDKRSGELIWQYNSNGLINTSPLLFNNIIIQANLSGKVEIIKKSDGQLLNQIEFDKRCRSTPIYYRDRVFFGVDKGDVYCYSFEEQSQ